MAFPNELPLNYYKGDTQEFSIFPKQNDGSAFIMTGYTVKFSIAADRGSTNITEAYAVIDSDNPTRINCAIRPVDGESLVAGTPYVYDVEISKSSTPYPLVYTVLTGNISVTDQVSSGG